MGVIATDSTALRADLRRLTPQLVDSVLEYSSTTADTEQDFAGRAKVVAAAQAIVDAAQPPQPAWMNQSSACAELVALRLFIEWGAFEAMPAEGSISFQDLADRISADMQIVRRLAWVMVSTGLLLSVGEDGIAHTDKSRHITESRPLTAMWQLIFDNSFMSSASLPRYFRTYGRKEPNTQNHVPFSFAMGEPEKPFWEVWNADANRRSYFMDAMTAIGKQVPLMGPIKGLYDFGRDAEAVRSSPPDRPLLVDVGGGKGHAIGHFCEGEGSLLSTDRCVLQDTPHVIESVGADPSLGLHGTKLMAIDFHKEQPVKGALFYYIRHCLHNYGDDVVVNILRHIADAMSQDSKLLVADYIMANPPSRHAVWMDFIMCMSGGKERTKGMWHDVVGRAGLRIVAFHGLDVSPDGHAVIECVKPEIKEEASSSAHQSLLNQNGQTEIQSQDQQDGTILQNGTDVQKVPGQEAEQTHQDGTTSPQEPASQGP